jgi:hypothetical protein
MVAAGQLTYWKRIEYFPYPVQRVVYISPFGGTLWVETDRKEFFEVRIPCNDGSCWTKLAALPEDPRTGWGDYFALEENIDCRFDRFTWPPPVPVKSCIGGYYAVVDTYEWLFLAITPSGKVWAWRSGTAGILGAFIIPVWFAVLGATPGAVLGWFGWWLTKRLRRPHSSSVPS